jgi:hypothetical protein
MAEGRRTPGCGNIYVEPAGSPALESLLAAHGPPRVAHSIARSPSAAAISSCHCSWRTEFSTLVPQSGHTDISSETAGTAKECHGLVTTGSDSRSLISAPFKRRLGDVVGQLLDGRRGRNADRAQGSDRVIDVVVPSQMYVNRENRRAATWAFNGFTAEVDGHDAPSMEPSLTPTSLCTTRQDQVWCTTR